MKRAVQPIAVLAIAMTMCTHQTLAASPESMPCVDGICLGDGPENLGRIQWDEIPQAAARPITGRQQQQLETLYKGHFDEIAHSLFRGKFDRRVLRSLDRVAAACRGNSLTGQFTSAGGNPTSVTLSLLPDVSGRQAWRVIAINRTFPDAKNRRQQEEIHQQLDASYGRYDMHRRSPKAGEASYLYAWMGMPTMVLNLNLPPPAVMETRFALNPLCDGQRKLSIR